MQEPHTEALLSGRCVIACDATPVDSPRDAVSAVSYLQGHIDLHSNEALTGDKVLIDLHTHDAFGVKHITSRGNLSL